MAPFLPRGLFLGPAAASENGWEGRLYDEHGDESVEEGGSFLSVVFFWLALFLFLHYSKYELLSFMVNRLKIDNMGLTRFLILRVKDGSFE